MEDLDLLESCFKQNGKIDEDEIFTEEELTRLVSYLKGQSDIRNFDFLLILASGLRMGELVVLKWEDFLDDSYAQFKVNKTKS